MATSSANFPDSFTTSSISSTVNNSNSSLNDQSGISPPIQALSTHFLNAFSVSSSPVSSSSSSPQSLVSPPDSDSSDNHSESSPLERANFGSLHVNEDEKKLLNNDPNEDQTIGFSIIDIKYNTVIDIKDVSSSVLNLAPLNQGQRRCFSLRNFCCDWYPYGGSFTSKLKAVVGKGIQGGGTGGVAMSTVFSSLTGGNEIAKWVQWEGEASHYLVIGCSVSLGLTLAYLYYKGIGRGLHYITLFEPRLEAVERNIQATHSSSYQAANSAAEVKTYEKRIKNLEKQVDELKDQNKDLNKKMDQLVRLYDKKNETRTEEKYEKNSGRSRFFKGKEKQVPNQGMPPLELASPV